MALEVVRLLRVPDGRSGRRRLPCRGVEVVAFSDEEGTRFGKALLGSSAVAGTWNDAWWDLADADGVSLRRAFLEFGLDPARVGEAARRPDELVGTRGAHRAGARAGPGGEPLAVVSSIASARRFQLVVEGEARHAGGTPTTCVATRCWARARPRWRSSGSAPPSTTSSAPWDASRRSPARST
jgi:allantoate deiminase